MQHDPRTCEIPEICGCHQFVIGFIQPYVSVEGWRICREHGHVHPGIPKQDNEKGGE